MTRNELRKKIEERYISNVETTIRKGKYSIDELIGFLNDFRKAIHALDEISSLLKSD